MRKEIQLDVVYEDEDLAVINKRAGMMVHAGAGATDAERNRGTLVNALLHRFGRLSSGGGEVRPGIVHRLDKATSGLIVVAKNDPAHQHLASQFAKRQVKKTYLALVHGRIEQEEGSINSSISRDQFRRIRMTTQREGGREAITHYTVQQRLETAGGKFTLLKLRIGTGHLTHQIRVHLTRHWAHPIVGDARYGSAATCARAQRNKYFAGAKKLHCTLTALEFVHPTTGEAVAFSTAFARGVGRISGRARNIIEIQAAPESRFTGATTDKLVRSLWL